MGPFQNLGARLPVAGTMAIVQVATISANDPTIGQFISSVTERVGREGVVTVEVATLTNQVEYGEGMQIDHG